MSENILEKIISKKIKRVDEIKKTTKIEEITKLIEQNKSCLLYTSPSPRDQRGSRMPSSA